jgi:hypothetical protein
MKPERSFSITAIDAHFLLESRDALDSIQRRLLTLPVAWQETSVPAGCTTMRA